MKPSSQTPSRFADVVAALAAYSGVGFLATSYLVSRWLTRSTRHDPGVPVGGDNWFWEPLECRTSDGLRLSGWVIAPPQPRATVALFHGMRGNRTRTLNRVAFLTQAGYRCVAFDHRAHGQSEGKITSFGYYESRDIAAVCEVIERLWPHQPRAAHGISMGAAAMCYGAEHARRFDAVILESVYHNLTAAFENRVGRDFPAWFRHFIKGVIWVTEHRLGRKIAQMAPVDYVDRLQPTPVLLLTGAEDPHATPEEVEDIQRRYTGPSEFYVIPEASHTDVCDKGGLAYQRLIVDFLERRLAARRLAA